MASPANIGFDATGRKTLIITLKRESESEKVEIHSMDLFDMEITFEKVPSLGNGIEEWQEKSRRILPDTGILGQYQEFKLRPDPFFL